MRSIVSLLVAVTAAVTAVPGRAASFNFSTGNPDGLIGTLSRPASTGKLETETADDFVLSQATRLDSATFTGLIPAGASLSGSARVEIEFYHVFPVDSTNPPSGHLATRVNAPSDGEIVSAMRDSLVGSLGFTTTLLTSSFTVSNTGVNGINASPNQFTGGEGAATGQEVQFNVTFTTPLFLPADHYFFRPEVGLSSGNFLWLSASKPIVAPGTPFASDLQSWISNSNLSPDWERIGTDITHQGPFNATFSLTGETVPLPAAAWSGLALLAGLGLAKLWRRRC